MVSFRVYRKEWALAVLAKLRYVASWTQTRRHGA